MKNFILLGFLCFICSDVTFGKLPDYIHVCKRTDPEFHACVKNSVEVIQPKLDNGIPELNVPGIEPLFIPKVVISTGTESANFRAIASNITVYGANSFKIIDLKIDLDKQKYTGTIQIPKLDFDAIYDIDVKILVLPIKGRGPIKATTYNTTSKYTLKGELIDDAGVTRLHFKRFHFDLHIDDYSVELGNLFGGDPVLGKATNQALNENRKEFIKVLKPIFQETIEEIFLNIANKVVQTFSFDELFPM